MNVHSCTTSAVAIVTEAGNPVSFSPLLVLRRGAASPVVLSLTHYHSQTCLRCIDFSLVCIDSWLIYSCFDSSTLKLQLLFTCGACEMKFLTLSVVCG